MHRRIVIIALAACAVAVGVGLAQADVSAGKQRFTFTGKTIRGKDLPIKVTATGPISANGTVRLTDHPTTSTATFRFASGTVNVRFVHGPMRAHPDLAKCRATIDARGTYTIVGGTGRYRGAAGKGTYTETRLLLGKRSATGKCLSGPNSTPDAVTAVATMVGTVTIRG